ncbi:hypothetical protein Q8G81_35675, partial [Klebsiella pneumoniae]
TGSSDITNPFAAKADVRLTKVRPYLIGLKATADHRLTIAHSGEETIQSQEDEALTFIHAPRPIPFQYSPDEKWTAMTA